jgi:CRISPR/Cas system-associated protein Cas5 (RAMP superfamily)
MIIGGIEITLGSVVDIIILIGALCAAIYKIWDFFAKPTSSIKKRRKEKQKELIREVLNEELPKRLEEHNIKTREKYKSDRQRYLKEIKSEVLEEVRDPISQNSDDLEALKISAKDVLREKIMAVYHKNKRERALPEHEKEALV